MDYVIAAPPLTTLPVAGDERRFPVRRVFCVGRNYAGHAREMGHDPDREPPFFFTKRRTPWCRAAARFPIRPRPGSCTTKSSWWSRSAKAAWTFPRRRPWTTCSSTPSASI